MLLEECAKGSVELLLGREIRQVSHGDGRFQVKCADRLASAPALVIATGGPSIPKMGATGFAYELARRFGLKVVEPRPALVPLTLGGDETLFRPLPRVASEVIARAGEAAFREAGLVRHKGVPGAAILQVLFNWHHGDRRRLSRNH